ncbi:hypothetical protein [Acetobacter sp.]|uniref:hypothetical protein n=1 Tax=Acetobacter sp. TaxID=440 RepID=UPI0039E85E35
MQQGNFAQRGLFAAVIGMGILIVAGVALLIAIIVHRMAHPAHSVDASQMAIAPVSKIFYLHQPVGSKIEQIEWRNGPIMAVRLSGGGPDRVVLWDTVAGRSVGELQLAP